MGNRFSIQQAASFWIFLKPFWFRKHFYFLDVNLFTYYRVIFIEKQYFITDEQEKNVNITQSPTPRRWSLLIYIYILKKIGLYCIWNHLVACFHLIFWEHAPMSLYILLLHPIKSAMMLTTFIVYWTNFYSLMFKLFLIPCYFKQCCDEQACSYFCNHPWLPL